MVALGRAVRPFCTRSREIRPAPSLHRASTDALIYSLAIYLWTIAALSAAPKSTHSLSVVFAPAQVVFIREFWSAHAYYTLSLLFLFLPR